MRTPVFAEMVELVNGNYVDFSEYLFNERQVRNALDNFLFSNNRAITKSMLTWWAFESENQKVVLLERPIEIEHIFARNRQENERSLTNPKNLESLGNKSLLEKRINIRASDYRFSDKKKYYLGFENSRGTFKEGTQFVELSQMAKNLNDFTEIDIEQRYERIINSFIDYLKANDLMGS